MFGNLGNSWTAGFSHLTDLSETFQKIRQDVEQNIESSLGIEGKAGTVRQSVTGTDTEYASLEGK